MLNFLLALFLAAVIYAVLYGEAVRQAQIEQQTGGRYVAYDSQVEFYPTNALIAFVVVFGVPNLALYLLGIYRRRSSSETGQH